jgi:hypothetical protein
MAKHELGRGLKQAIVSDTLIKAGVKTFKRSIASEVKEKVIERAQERLDKAKAGGDARQIVNYFFNPTNHERLSSLQEMAERLKAPKGETSARRPAKKASTRKSAPRKHAPATSTPEAQAA